MFRQLLLSLALATIPVLAPTASAQSTSPPAAMFDAAGVKWHTDYGAACRDALKNRRMLLINFVAAVPVQTGFENFLAGQAQLQQQLQNFTLLRVRLDDAAGQQIIKHPAFAECGGLPGIVIIDFANVGQPYYQQAVTLLPFANIKYYRWNYAYFTAALTLPPGTLSQRTMIWAVRVHPERPQSTNGVLSPVLARATEVHSQLQADMGVQGHHNFQQRFDQLRGAVPANSVSEVCAESWPSQGLLDSCLDCVRSWRQSPGHWRGVSSPCRTYGYDIKRGRNGIWYGTGLFAD